MYNNSAHIPWGNETAKYFTPFVLHISNNVSLSNFSHILCNNKKIRNKKGTLKKTGTGTAAAAAAGIDFTQRRKGENTNEHTHTWFFFCI